VQLLPARHGPDGTAGLSDVPREVVSRTMSPTRQI
jgi:hypothetical protein